MVYVAPGQKLRAQIMLQLAGRFACEVAETPFVTWDQALVTMHHDYWPMCTLLDFTHWKLTNGIPPDA